MNRSIHSQRGLLRSTAWMVLVCFLALLAAPATFAAPTSAKPDLPGYEDPDGIESGSFESDDEDSSASQDGEDEDSDDDDDDSNASEDRLYRSVPRDDRNENSRTLSAIFGGLGVGLLGLTFGPVGFLLGGALGAGLGYVIGTQLFPKEYEARYEGSPYTDPYYDSRYGAGSTQYPWPSADRGSHSPGALEDAERAYNETLSEYREVLRRGTPAEITAARTAYQEAYQEWFRARAQYR